MREQFLITFNIVSYSDSVLFDFVPMDACHVLLGRPWQYDKRVIYDRWKNTYPFEKDGNKFKLQPSNKEMEKEGKVMIVSYEKDIEKQLDGGNKEKHIGATTKELLKEKRMGLCHSHNTFVNACLQVMQKMV